MSLSCICMFLHAYAWTSFIFINSLMYNAMTQCICLRCLATLMIYLLTWQLRLQVNHLPGLCSLCLFTMATLPYMDIRLRLPSYTLTMA
ncbi:ORF27 [Fowl aviadenovirus 2]|uniref:ORF27 n=1 Tax=Fowl aviadenovirus 2 TaxID=172859 RepID=A0A7G3VX69_9ADEN|nr:ORF27 [Fowl aviadenovirus 2]